MQLTIWPISPCFHLSLKTIASVVALLYICFVIVTAICPHTNVQKLLTYKLHSWHNIQLFSVMSITWTNNENMFFFFLPVFIGSLQFLLKIESIPLFYENVHSFNYHYLQNKWHYLLSIHLSAIWETFISTYYFLVMLDWIRIRS